MKFLQVYRLGLKRSLQLLPAYVGAKFLRRQLIKEQDVLIAYFNILVNFDLMHVKEKENYFVVAGKGIGSLALRKPYSSDAGVFRQVFKEEEYRELCHLIKKYIPHGDVTMIDGGANVGLTSIYIQQGINGSYSLRSVLVEPSGENVQMIRENLALQHIQHFNIEQAGLYNKPCFLKITNNFRDKLEWSIQVEETTDVTDLKAVEINTLIEKYGWQGLDILKLDIEGAERFLFNDELYAASFLSKTGILAVELHGEYVDSDKVLAMLAGNGFELSRFGELYIGINRNKINKSLI